MSIVSNFLYIHQLSRTTHVSITTALNTGFYLLQAYWKPLVHCWFVDLHYACHSLDRMFLCHSIKISIPLELLNQSFTFFHHCKGKSMTYLEVDIIFSRFLLFLIYSPIQWLRFCCCCCCCFVLFCFVLIFFFTHPVYFQYIHIYEGADFMTS